MFAAPVEYRNVVIPPDDYKVNAFNQSRGGLAIAQLTPEGNF